MTDTIIANLPPEALRSIVRGLLGVDPKVTPAFHDLVSGYLLKTKPALTTKLFAEKHGSPSILPAFLEFRSRYRCLMGCGQGFETVRLLQISIVILYKQSLLSRRSLPPQRA